MRALGRSDFRFRFAAFQLTKRKVNEIGVRVTNGQNFSDEFVYTMNYCLIEPGNLDFVADIDYNRLMDCVAEEVPSYFFQQV